MKRLCYLVLVGVVSLGGAGVSSAIPQLINYQGYLTDNVGVPVADGNYSLTFRIWDAETGGNQLWSEDHPTVSVANGLFNVILGGDSPLTLPFDVDYWLGVQIGAEPELSRIRLTSVGYSYRAGVADFAVDANYAGNADMVDGIHANATAIAHHLYPLAADAKFPASVLPTGLPPGPHASTHCSGGSDEITCFLKNTGPDTITASSNYAALTGRNSTGNGLYGMATSAGSGVAGYGATGNGVYGSVGHDNGQYAGVLGYASGGANGVKGHSVNGAGVYAESDNGPAFWGASAYNHAIIVDSSGMCGLYIDSTRAGAVAWTGAYIRKAGWNGYAVDGTGANGLWLMNIGMDGIHLLDAVDNGCYMWDVGLDGVNINHAGRHGFYVYEPDSIGLLVDSASSYGVLARSKYRSGGGFETETAGYYALYARSAGGLSTNAGLTVYGYANATGGFTALLSESKGQAGFCMLSADVEVIASGSGRLWDGMASVSLGEPFADAISSEVPLKITVTPRGDWSGLYIAESSAEGFTVKTGAGADNVEFDWVAIGRKKGCETRPAVLMQEVEERKARPADRDIPRVTGHGDKSEE